LCYYINNLKTKSHTKEDAMSIVEFPRQNKVFCSFSLPQNGKEKLNFLQTTGEVPVGRLYVHIDEENNIFRTVCRGRKNTTAEYLVTDLKIWKFKNSFIEFELDWEKIDEIVEELFSKNKKSIVPIFMAIFVDTFVKRNLAKTNLDIDQELQNTKKDASKILERYNLKELPEASKDDFCKNTLFFVKAYLIHKLSNK
jgi:hypothetical protein